MVKTKLQESVMQKKWILDWLKSDFLCLGTNLEPKDHAQHSGMLRYVFWLRSPKIAILGQEGNFLSLKLCSWCLPSLHQNPQFWANLDFWKYGLWAILSNVKSSLAPFLRCKCPNVTKLDVWAPGSMYMHCICSNVHLDLSTPKLQFWAIYGHRAWNLSCSFPMAYTVVQKHCGEICTRFDRLNSVFKLLSSKIPIFSTCLKMNEMKPKVYQFSSCLLNLLLWTKWKFKSKRNSWIARLRSVWMVLPMLTLNLHSHFLFPKRKC